MAVLHNDTFLRALLKQPVDYTPVWLMRQAGRYLPEYRATRAKAGSFLALCHNPELATEVTLQPLERFRLDAAILFSDILTVPDAMGLGLHFVEGEGPKFTHPLQHEQDVARLQVPDMSRLRYVFDAVRSIRLALNGRVPLIGFSGSPFTLACYMIEGGGSRDFRLLKTMLYQRPQLLHRILDINAQAVTAYLNEQVAAGAQAVQIFDTWGGVLSDAAFREFDLFYLQQVVSGLQREANGRRVPVIVFTKGGGQWLEQLAALDVDALGVDWTVNLHQARHQVGQRVALQGNLDPLALFGTSESIECEIKRLLAAYGAGSGHVFNLGHGINQFTDPEMVKFAVDAVHRLSVEYHQN
ncbi:uroporphyrinogen decarboxylase [Snodgrassella gandavensis]|uniref:uroporphyrinogen decarboxylase n=1 Tax=Snodgrassella gandavensis TaxID=2946698 RepID=UPI001EF44D3D|nr:uroporphyrinogen decarboxylase [Snodgrassella gandavensis]